jgi:hypothetical protein
MSKYRKVSALDTAEALEVQVTGAVENPDATLTLTVGSIASWATETDFITYARDPDTNAVVESSRVVWRGTKVDNTNITATRTGGSLTDDLSDGGYFATVVPTHLWANDLAGGVGACLPADGLNGIKSADGDDLAFIVSETQPEPIADRTIVWLRTLS